MRGHGVEMGTLRAWDGDGRIGMGGHGMEMGALGWGDMGWSWDIGVRDKGWNWGC